MPPASERAVFLSYASQNADAARRICEALRATGIEVWFDQSELSGGDAWDQKIRGQIKACALFVPIISASTQARLEGYFRLEWKLAAQRTHTMADAKPFLLPILIDGTRDDEAHVPAEFHLVQWTRLRQDDGGQARDEAIEAFCSRVRQLLAGGVARAFHPVSSELAGPKARATSSAPAPAEKSVAVLAFANLSPDPENEYFSDGLSEDLIGMLGRIPGLTVRGRTSAFFYKGKNVPMPEIARRLGVTYIVRGSVRRAGQRVRVSAQLSRAADDEVVWSSAPLERELKDVFAVQDELVALIAKNLSLRLGGAARAPRTVNPEAHRLVLEGQYFFHRGGGADIACAEKAFINAVALAPDYAEAHIELSRINAVRVIWRRTEGGAGDPLELRAALELAERAVELDPSNPDAMAVQAMAYMLEGKLEESELRFRDALALNPNSPFNRMWHALLLVNRGRLAAATAENAKAMELDPMIDYLPQLQAILALEAEQFDEALAYTQRVAAALGVTFIPNLGVRVMALRGLGRDAEAVETAREMRAKLADWPRWAWDPAAIDVLRAAGHASEAEAYATDLFAVLPADASVRGGVLAALGRFDEALPFLENMSVLARRGLFWHQNWDRWRDDPRFHQLLRKIGCAEDYAVARAELAKMRAAKPL